MTKKGQAQEEQQAAAQEAQETSQEAQETSAEAEQAAPEASSAQDIAALEEQLTELEQQVSGLQNQVTEEQEKALRAVAEADNVRRRAAQDVEKARNFALEKFAGELLPVIDNLERALANIDQSDASQQAVIEGIEMTHKSFLQTIEKFGMEVVDPEGQPFDPQHHEAMSMQPSDEVPPNTVMSVLQKGYLLNGRLLRPAMVMVSQASN